MSACSLNVLRLSSNWQCPLPTAYCHIHTHCNCHCLLRPLSNAPGPGPAFKRGWPWRTRILLSMCAYGQLIVQSVVLPLSSATAISVLIVGRLMRPSSSRRYVLHLSHIVNSPTSLTRTAIW